MVARRTLRWLTAVCALGPALWIALAPVANADTTSGLVCATTSPVQSEATAGDPGPCWVDVTPYPFGADGNPVVVPPSLPAEEGTDSCASGEDSPGPTWDGDYQPTAQDPCYEQVTSMAFRAWNRGLAATQEVPTADGGSAGNNAYGVWLYNGTSWFPDPTFPGSSSCPGSTIMWAGKLDYWLIGSPSSSSTTLCHFDGVNMDWDVLTLPAASVAHLPLTSAGTRQGGVTSGTCLAWDDCWFFGTDGIRVHWDGESLSDESDLVADDPWLTGNFTAATSTTLASGQLVGLAVNSGEYYIQDGQDTLDPTPTQPGGASAPEAYGLSAGEWSPLAMPASTAQIIQNPYQPTALAETAINGAGDTWIAAEPANAAQQEATAQPAPLIKVTDTLGTVCADPTPTYQVATSGPSRGEPLGLQWSGLSVAPDGSVTAGGASYEYQTTELEPGYIAEPVIVQGGCVGSSGTQGSFRQIEFRTPDPLDSDPRASTTPLVPADDDASISAVAAPATNRVWAASPHGEWLVPVTGDPGQYAGAPQRPHLYLYTDGQPPDAPAGDDNETRPSLFTLSPPVYQVSPATIVTESVTKTVTKKTKRKSVKLKPAVYALHTHLDHHAGKYTLRVTFRVRRPVTLGLAALHGKRVVARTPLKLFKKHTGELSVRIKRSAWPTGLKLLTPKARKTKK